MATTIHTYKPKILVAGDTWKWKRKDLSTDYPSSEWTLIYQPRGATTGTISITSGRDGTYEKFSDVRWVPRDWDWVDPAFKLKILKS